MAVVIFSDCGGNRSLRKARIFLNKLLEYHLSINPFKAIGGHFDPEKLKKLYVDGASKINTSNYANGSTYLLSFREN